jgi:hypothetical protein
LWAAVLLALLGAVNGCSATKALEPLASTTPEAIAPAATPPPEPEDVASLTDTATPASDSNIGKVDETGTTVVVDVPDDEVCRPKTVSITKAVFETCLIDGLTFVQVSNTIGFEGNLVSQSGNTQIRRWSNGGKILLGTFRNGKLVSKSQVNLE